MVISIETGALGTVTSSDPLSSRAVCVLSIRSRIVRWRRCNNSIFELLVALRHINGYKMRSHCKLPKFD